MIHSGEDTLAAFHSHRSRGLTVAWFPCKPNSPKRPHCLLHGPLILPHMQPKDGRFVCLSFIGRSRERCLNTTTIDPQQHTR